MADIAYIPIRQLHPHPDNPRKELGDLSELAASIKENGVYQNLTVIPGHYLGKQEYIARCIADGGDVSAAEAAWTPKAVWSSEDYTIIIGHRRAAAAQQAGKFELPCSVVDMTEKEQLQTMMVENMQRSDLTVYEQAQGFQMMLDMGDTVECVADRSGFSQSTIRRRIKLLELNHDNFKKAEQRGATLSDFVELNKIEDLDARNRVLETLGTANFNREMQNALSDQKYQHRKAEWIEQLRQFAVENPDANYSTHTHVAGYGYWNTSKDVEVPDDADSVAYCYKVSQNQIDLYKERDLEKENAEKAKASPPAGAEPKRVQRKEIHKGTAYGVLRLRCPKCGDVFGRFLREPSASVTCRCGGEVQLDNLTRYEFTCPCCDFEAHGRTNLEDHEITVPCKCGNPVTMKWDRNKRMYHE